MKGFQLKLRNSEYSGMFAVWGSGEKRHYLQTRRTLSQVMWYRNWNKEVKREHHIGSRYIVAQSRYLNASSLYYLSVLLVALSFQIRFFTSLIAVLVDTYLTRQRQYLNWVLPHCDSMPIEGLSYPPHHFCLPTLNVASESFSAVFQVALHQCTGVKSYYEIKSIFHFSPRSWGLAPGRVEAACKGSSGSAFSLSSNL